MAASASNESYHTVDIRADLPQIKKQYDSDKPKDLPPTDYWTNWITGYFRNTENNYKIESSRFKMQHIISNGSCKFSDKF